MGLSLFRFRSVLPAALAYLLLAVRPAAAAQVTIAWDPNTETDIAGYIVEYGPAAAPFSQSADVGNVTTWTLTTALPGTNYSFRVVAYNANGERSDASTMVTASTVTPGGPTLTADRAALRFGMIASSTRPTTTAQVIRLTQAGAGPATWTVTSSAPWLQVSPASGSGSGSFTVTIVAAAAPSAASSATISIAADGTSNVIDPIPVSFTVLPAAGSQPPIGAVDTPTDNATGVTGSMAITGWALDDVGVTRVRIYRDPVAGETPGQRVFIGDATQVEDARPDVANLFANYPASYRGGWGYLALTNMLPNGGNGTYRFSAYAEDGDGHSMLLGMRTVTCSNATATQPFGAIDTPAPGETVSGGNYTSFGWVLSRGPKRADVPGGGTVTVLIDGNPVGAPAGWGARTDLVSAFPAAQYPGVTSALALFGFDTTSLSNGMHTMAWIVTDNQGVTSGVGSRYFRVFNGASAPVTAVRASAVAGTVTLADEIAGAQRDRSGMFGRRGFSLDTPFRRYDADTTGRVVVQAEELDRIEVLTHGAAAGYLLWGDGPASTDVRPLPIGSNLDGSGRFVWQPGPGFVGRYDLAFVRQAGPRLIRQDVTIVLNPKGSNRVGPQLIVDIAGGIVAGWAADLDSTVGTGIDGIHVWAYPVTASGHGNPLFVDVAAYGGARPDVAAVYGDQFLNSGYGVAIRNLPPGTYDFALFPWSTAKHDFLDASLVRVVVGR
jgi:Fibronectin type III domain/Viral BACON domain/Bacterial Ig domain